MEVRLGGLAPEWSGCGIFTLGGRNHIVVGADCGNLALGRGICLELGGVSPQDRGSGQAALTVRPFPLGQRDSFWGSSCPVVGAGLWLGGVLVYRGRSGAAVWGHSQCRRVFPAFPFRTRAAGLVE